MQNLRKIFIGLVFFILHSTSVATDSCETDLNPRMFSLEPEKAILGKMEASFSIQDYIEEFIALGGSAALLRFSHWELRAGPISKRVLEFFRSFPELSQRLDLHRENLIVEVGLVKVGTNEYLDLVRERRFRMEGAKNFQVGGPESEGKDIYMFAISPEDELVAPMEFFTGKLPPSFLSEIREKKVDLSLTWLPFEVEDQVYRMRNGELVHFNGYTLYRKTPASEAGLVYWVRIVFNKP